MIFDIVQVQGWSPKSFNNPLHARRNTENKEYNDCKNQNTFSIPSHSVNQSKAQRHSVNHSIRIKNRLNLNENQLKLLAEELRNTHDGYNRKAVETRAFEKIKNTSHDIDELFTVEHLHVNNVVPKATVCNNFPCLVSKTFESRRSTSELHENNFLVGIDSGGGSLKITLAIKAIDEHRSSFGKRKLRKTGVKKTL